MQIHHLKRKTKNKKKILVGRGGKRGKTAGRGTKGQKARAGRKIRPEIRDTIKKLPKLRGYAFNSIQAKPIAVAITLVEKHFEDGNEIKISSLVEKGIIETKNGKNPSIKIVGGKSGYKPTKKMHFTGLKVTEALKALIEKAGGSVK